MLCTHFSSKHFTCDLNACKLNIHGSISALLMTLTTVLMLQKSINQYIYNAPWYRGA